MQVLLPHFSSSFRLFQITGSLTAYPISKKTHSSYPSRRTTHQNPYSQSCPLNQISSPNCFRNGRAAAEAYWRRVEQLELELNQLKNWIDIEKNLRDYIDNSSLIHSLTNLSCETFQWLHLLHKVTKPKSEGGLGIRKLKTMNEALLGKWLWRRVAVEKYGGGVAPWEVKHPRDPYGVTVWRGISNVNTKFREGFKIEVHNGVHTRFWVDSWLCEEPLKCKFPSIFGISRKKMCFVSEMKVFGQANGWDLGLNRRLPEAAIDELTNLLSSRFGGA